MAALPQARIGDRTFGLCSDPSHFPILLFPTGGIIVEGSPNVSCNNKKVARDGDLVLSDCGHPGIIIGSSNSVKTNNKKNARMGDAFIGIYVGTIIEGSPNKFTGD